MAALQNGADYRLSLEGRDLSPGSPNTFSDILREKFLETISPRLISLSLRETRGGEADTLDLVLHDHDGALEIPQPGAVLSLSLGWSAGPDVEKGLIDKGRFKVDEASWEGPPDIVTIRARSADFAASFDKRREGSHVMTTLGAIVRDIASASGLSAKIDSALDALEVEAIEQDELSDAALLRSLGRRYDAAATVKNGTLLFLPIGGAGGGVIPPGTLTRRSGDQYRYRRGERGQFAGVEARWHDKRTGERQTVVVESVRGAGGSDTRGPKRLKRIYATEKSAQAAARSSAAKIDRAQAEFEMELALGRPELYPERPMSLSGFKPEIDARSWLISEAEHTLSGEGGLGTRLKLEAAA
jgi:phage protein D